MAALSVSETSSTEQPLDFLVRKASKEDDNTVIQRLQRFIVEATQAPIRAQYEVEASLTYSYVENDFYTQDELAEFARRGQPPTKQNEIAPILEKIAGQFIQTRQVATFLGRNTPADDPVASMAQDYQRWNDQRNNYQFLEQDQAWDGLVGGVGWIKGFVTRNALGQSVIRFRVVNPFHVFKDPLSTNYDPNEDAKYIVEGSWMDLEDAIALFPDREEELLAYIGSGGTWGSPYTGQVKPSLLNEGLSPAALYAISVHEQGGRKRVRPFEVWYKRKIKVYYLFKDDGVLALPVPLDAKTAHTLVKQLGKGLVAESQYQDRMYTGVLLGNLLIHHDVSEHATNLFPYLPFYSGMRKNGCPLSLGARLVPGNELINKISSKAVSLMSNRQTIAEKTAIEDPLDFQEEKAKPDGLMIVRDGALTNGKVINTNNLDIGQGNLALLQEQKDALMRTANLPNDANIEPGQVRSGTGIARLQSIGWIANAPVSNNLSRTRYMKACLQYELMKQYLTEEQAFQITDDPNAPRTVQVTKGHLQALKEREYDIVITEMKDYAVQREQQVESFMTVLPALAQLGPAWVMLGLQLSELRDKDGLIKMVQEQMSQGPAMPKISLNQDWKDLTPEMQAYYALTSFKSQELAQAILQQGEDPAYLKKLKADLVNTQIKEGTRATIERGRVDLSALTTAMQGRLQAKQMFQDDQHKQMDMMNQGAPPV